MWKVAIIGGKHHQMRTEVYDESLGLWQHAPEYDIPAEAEHMNGKFCWETPDGGIVYIEKANAKVNEGWLIGWWGLMGVGNGPNYVKV